MVQVNNRISRTIDEHVIRCRTQWTRSAEYVNEDAHAEKVFFLFELPAEADDLVTSGKDYGDVVRALIPQCVVKFADGGELRGSLIA